MRFVPEESDQRWIVEHLAELVRHRGRRSFLDAPIIQPAPAFFPDRWDGQLTSVERLLRRILGYAGLRALTIDVEIFDEGDEPAVFNLQGAHDVREAAAWFAGLDDDGVARFGVARYHLRDAEGLASILCHEAAHAYRARHGLTYFDADEDELLTDLTTVYLGFGIMTANLTHRVRRTGDGIAKKMGGYLSPVAMSSRWRFNASPAISPATSCEASGGSSRARRRGVSSNPSSSSSAIASGSSWTSASPARSRPS
jgi:hypothetical protein